MRNQLWNRISKSVGHKAQASPQGYALSQPQETLQTYNSATINCWQLSFFYPSFYLVIDLSMRSRAEAELQSSVTECGERTFQKAKAFV